MSLLEMRFNANLMESLMNVQQEMFSKADILEGMTKALMNETVWTEKAGRE